MRLQTDTKECPSQPDKPLVFRMSSAEGAPKSAASEPNQHLSDDVRALLEGIAAVPKTRSSAEIATTLLDRPGLGVCIPDLVLRREGLPDPVYVELLGFWSRDAVWRRAGPPRARRSDSNGSARAI